MDVQVGARVDGALLPEPIEVIATVPVGDSLKVIGRGLRTNLVHQPILSPEQLAQLTIGPVEPPFDGDAASFRLGIEAQRLGLAYEYDPYFSLSIARVDPLPHQLEAVYLRSDRGLARRPRDGASRASARSRSRSSRRPRSRPS